METVEPVAAPLPKVPVLVVSVGGAAVPLSLAVFEQLPEMGSNVDATPVATCSPCRLVAGCPDGAHAHVVLVDGEGALWRALLVRDHAPAVHDELARRIHRVVLP